MPLPTLRRTTNRLRPVFAQASVAALALSALALTAPSANAQANLVFSGGSGSPLSLTLTAPVTYTIITTPTSFSSPLFVFDAVGGTPFNFSTATATITFSINGGTDQTINRINKSFSGGDVTSDDIYILGSLPGVVVGDIVTLSSGTLTTNSNIAVAAPASGSFTTFITNSGGSPMRLSTNGIAGANPTAAPEPGTLPLVGMGLISGLGMVKGVRRRKQAQAK